MSLLLTILSWSWIILGIWWFFRPAAIKKRLDKRFRKTLRWILFAVLFATAGVVFAAGRSVGGIVGTLFIILALICIIKALLFVRGGVSDAVLDWWGSQPTWVYRASAAGLFALGCLTQWALYRAD